MIYRILQTSLWALLTLCALAWTVAHMRQLSPTAAIVSLSFTAICAALAYASWTEHPDDA